MLDDLKLLCNFDVLREKKIILYGASEGGDVIYDALVLMNMDILAFCDTNHRLWGNSKKDKPILSIVDLAELAKTENIHIIISTTFYAEVYPMLEKILPEKVDFFSYDAFMLGMYRHMLECSKDFENTELFQLLARKYENRRWNDEYPYISFSDFIGMRRNEIEPIIVFCPGKVGSMTLINSIGAVELWGLHIHNFSFSGKKFCDFYDKDSEIKFVCLVREPIARDFSMYFQIFEHRNYYSCAYKNDFLGEISNFMMQIAGMKDDTMILPGPMFQWFDDELKRTTGIDVFHYPFDKEKGYTVIREGNLSLLLIKSEKLNDLESVIADFLQRPNFKLLNANQAEEKPLARLYKQAKDALVLPKEYLAYYYENNKRMDHFYTDEEKDMFRKKWEK